MFAAWEFQVKNLLLPIDFSAVTRHAIAAVERLACDRSAKIWVLYCVNQMPALAAVTEAPAVLLARDCELPERFPREYGELERIVAHLRKRGLDAEGIFTSGAVADAILSAATEHQVDMIVMGARGHRTFYDVFVGSVTKLVLQRAVVPVLVVPPALSEGSCPPARKEDVAPTEQQLAN